jgi:hypothetical protein
MDVWKKATMARSIYCCNLFLEELKLPEALSILAGYSVEARISQIEI